MLVVENMPDNTNDTIFDVKKIGVKNEWVYALGKYNKKEFRKTASKKGWLHIADQGKTAVFIHRPFDKEESFYGRKNAVMHTPQEALTTLSH